jgi:hypothetical protein
MPKISAPFCTNSPVLPFSASCITLAGLMGKACSRLEWRKIYTTIGVSAISDGHFYSYFGTNHATILMKQHKSWARGQEHVADDPLVSLIHSNRDIYIVT